MYLSKCQNGPDSVKLCHLSLAPMMLFGLSNKLILYIYHYQTPCSYILLSQRYSHNYTWTCDHYSMYLIITLVAICVKQPIVLNYQFTKTLFGTILLLAGQDIFCQTLIINLDYISVSSVLANLHMVLFLRWVKAVLLLQ